MSYNNKSKCCAKSEPLNKSDSATNKQASHTASCCGIGSQASSPDTLSTSSSATNACCDHEQKRFDWLLWGSLTLCTILYALAIFSVPDQNLSHTAAGHPAHGAHGSASSESNHWLTVLSHSIFELLNTMWWSVALAVVFVGLIDKIPQNFVMSVLGQGGSKRGLFRATLAGVLLDLCSHGILAVGMELRKKGASLGQVMAFLIASPWNSLSLTLIMIALIGLPWTLAFIGLSMVLGITTGWMFDCLEERGSLPSNPVQFTPDPNFHFLSEARTGLHRTEFNGAFFLSTLKGGLRGSQMVIRWLLFGVLLASAIRAFVSLDDFQTFFGPTILGLIATLVAATIIEVCSEGSTPIAADLLTRANAPGNSFAFIMGGVATDYTEVMVIKGTMHSWKTALFLPLLTIPQVVVVAIILNQAA